MLSIDIGTKKICVAEGRIRADIVSITAFDEIAYENEVIDNGNIVDRPALSFMINEIIQRNRMKSKDVVVTVGSSESILREFRLPDVKDKQLKLLVQNEMSRIVRDDHGFLVDFVTTGLTQDNLVSVTACAMPKSIVESYYTLLKEIKLTPYAMSVPEDAMAKLFAGSAVNGQALGEGNTLVLDIGYANLSFYGFSNGINRFNRTEVSPMQDFVREVATINRSDINTEMMARLNFGPGVVYEEQGMSEACAYFVYRLSEEMNKHLQYLAANSEINSIDRVYLCGGISAAEGLDAALSTALRIPVERVNNVGRLNTPKGAPATKLCVAAGALIRK